MAKARPLLTLKGRELVAPEEDRRLEIGTYDLLLPCRRYDIEYKVAVLGLVSPTLEFLLRLLRSAPGLSEDDVRAFFGYSRGEVEYVIGEGVSPGYVERRGARLWLTQAGEDLFTVDEGGPMIFAVEARRNSHGFDLLAVAPEQHRSLDKVERSLPDLSLEEHGGVGRVSERIPDRFRRFFRELGDRNDREQARRKDLYSIDGVVPGDRFQVPVRLRVFAQASSPNMPEADLTSWRSQQDLSERPEVEQAAGRFLAEMKATRHPEGDASGYRMLTDLAPEFLKDFTTGAGLSVHRYWREAVSRAGEPRSDRRTIALVGPLFLQANIERFMKVVEYGLRDGPAPNLLLSVPPRIRHWGCTTLLQDLLSVVRLQLKADDATPIVEAKTVCMHVGKPTKYIAASFDAVEKMDATDLPGPVELFVVPGIAAAAIVHAPIGALSAVPAPLGFASFDHEVVRRTHMAIIENVCRYVEDEETRIRVEESLAIDRR